MIRPSNTENYVFIPVRGTDMKKNNAPAGINIPGSVVTAKSARAYLLRVAAIMLGRVHGKDFLYGSIALDEIEQRIVSAGYLTWEDCDAIEAEALAA